MEAELQMTGDPPRQSDAASYALKLANGSYEWYRDRAIRCRRAYRISETTLLVSTTAVPASAVLSPGNSAVTGTLGALVVILHGLRSIFHWQDNFLRFSRAREAIEAERRLYHTHANPYDNPETREQQLAMAVSRIEQEEMSGWIKIAADRPKS
ncbi:MAG TPA: DUF4231 domain-containing protein [Actinophytocola sp.]|uniref:DUF4231 domain-containing protein n=1 Tax=Actinophytocola sp. TaxID=1872138 RepID=UPI002DDD497A|nr:DUF4231 domain-containing protein [Actinophytocola sp.]HEV2783978.1 DUF4231 domain-containing protein [Actinophytocola sp.]